MIRKSRNFNGCWTCRVRKVKCDLTRPVCSRCRKSKIDCAGYDLKLGWPSPLTISSKDNSLVELHTDNDERLDSSHRRNVELVKFPDEMYYKTYKQLANIIDSLEIVIMENDETKWRKGPFQVFSVHSGDSMARVKRRAKRSRNTSYAANGGSRARKQRSAAKETVSTSPDEPDDNETVDNSMETGSLLNKKLLNYAKLTIVAIKGIHYELGDQNMFHILYPKFFPNIDSDEWTATPAVMRKLYYIENEHLVIHPLMKELVQSFDAKLLVLMNFYTLSNPLDTILIPFVKSLIADLVLYTSTSWFSEKGRAKETMSPEHVKNEMKMAVFYLVLSISAFKRSQVVGVWEGRGDEPFRIDEPLQISIETRKLAITILDRHLDEYDNYAEIFRSDDISYENILILCMILQVQADSYYSIFENFQLIFALGDYIVKSKYRDRACSNISKLLVKTFEIMAIKFESTLSVNLFNYSIEEGNSRLADEDSASPSGRAGDAYSISIENASSPEDERVGGNNSNFLSSILNHPQESAASLPDSKSPIMIPEFPNVAHRESLPVNIDISGKPHGDSLDIDSLYVHFGLPKSLLTLFHKIVLLTNHKRLLETRGTIGEDFKASCKKYEQRLLSWDLSHHWRLYTEIEGKKTFFSRFHECLYLNVMSFYTALIVYYNRLIDHADSDHIQVYVHRSVSYLEQLLQLAASSDEFLFRPSFWTVLISGSELISTSQQQHLAQLWVTSQLKVLNSWRPKQILYEIWSRRDLGEAAGWMDMVREWDVVLCLL